MVAYVIATTPPTGGSGVSFTSTDVTIPAISGYVPVLGDVVYLFGNCNSETPTVLTIAEWSIAATTVVTSTNIGFVRGHAITPAEVTAGTNSWTIAGQFSSGAAGRGTAVVVRGRDSEVVTSTFSPTSSAAVTPAAVTPGVGGSLVLVYVAPDDTGRGIGDPGAGWSVLVKGSSNVGVTSQLLARRDAFAPGGVAVDMTNAAVTLNSADEWAAITVAIEPPPPAGGIFAVL